VREPALVPRVFSQAFCHAIGTSGARAHRSALDVQLPRSEFDDETYSKLPVDKTPRPASRSKKALQMINEAERQMVRGGRRRHQ